MIIMLIFIKRAIFPVGAGKHINIMFSVQFKQLHTFRISLASDGLKRGLSKSDGSKRIPSTRFAKRLPHFQRINPDSEYLQNTVQHDVHDEFQ